MTTFFIVFGGIALFAVLVTTWDLIARRVNRRPSARLESPAAQARGQHGSAGKQR